MGTEEQSGMKGARAKATILEELRAGSGYVSGQALARKIGISRPGVWKHVEALRAEGYGIDAVPRLGYKLHHSPDLLVPEEIIPRLNTDVIGHRIVRFDSVTSTNDVAKDLAEKGEPEGTVVLAETQGSGRGRLGRAWVSPPGGIYFSVIVRPRLPPNELSKITLMSAVGVAAAVRETTGLAATIKWPNDILIDGAKIVGILTEMAAEFDVVRFAVIGVGINANTSVEDYPLEVRESVTTLRTVLGRLVDRIELCAAALRHLDREFGRVGSERFEEVLGSWREMSSTLGSRVRVSTIGGAFEGTAVGLGPGGELVVESDGGVERSFASGEVQHLRSA